MTGFRALRISFRSIVLLGVVYSTSVGAQTTPPRGDPARGATIASGSLAGVAACASCHGELGEGRAAAGYPRLAGLPAYYIVKQLRDYGSGVRTHPLKAVQVRQMSDQDILDSGAYYEQLKAPYPARVKAQGKAIERGGALAQIGSASLALASCDSCHGPQGQGLAPTIPYLAGQHPQYIAAQLLLWREGQRKNDGAGAMASIAKKLVPRDIEAVAQYYGQQRPSQLP